MIQMASSPMKSLMMVALIVLAITTGKVSAFSSMTMRVESTSISKATTKINVLSDDSTRRREFHLRRKEEWINNSVEYYSRVMREDRRRSLGQWTEEAYDSEEFTALAKKHYFARYKIKNGARRQAEVIYRKIIDDLINDKDGGCDHSQLAVTTLLLALLLQQMGDHSSTRKVFCDFFRLAVAGSEEGTECACSAKVLQAYALFEMKRGNTRKSLAMAKRAIQFDPSLAPLLKWKQFRDVLARARPAARVAP